MKKLLFPLLLILLFTSCQKQIAEENVPGVNTKGSSSVAAGNANQKIDVCHTEGNGSWHTINISVSALPAHLAHGDIVPDADGDGYTKVNQCGNGNQDDCNDLNAAVNPGVAEICSNNIDDNCNGQIDEGCIPSVTICNQVWMLKNLDVSTYRNGDPIPQVTDPAAWSALTTGAWCYYANSTANGTTYGKLYNWYAVNDPRGLAPTGWHIPNDAEWTALANCLGGAAVAGGEMKETGDAHWYNNTYATNNSGFTALPGGYLADMFYNITYETYFWSSTEVDQSTALARYLQFTNAGLSTDLPGNAKYAGFSVRCIRN